MGAKRTKQDNQGDKNPQEQRLAHQASGLQGAWTASSQEGCGVMAAVFVKLTEIEGDEIRVGDMENSMV